MTAPAQAPATPEELDAESLAYELAAEAAVTAALAAEISVAAAALWAAYATVVAAAGTLTEAAAAALGATAARVFGRISPELGVELERQVRRGLGLGARQARNYVSVNPDIPAVKIVDVDLRRVVRNIDTRAQELLDQAAARGRAGLRTADDVAAVTGLAGGAVRRAEADTRWAANRAVNAGARSVAEAVGYRLMWVAERDACLHCLAYSGRVEEPGDLFPGELTFADRPISLPAVPYPPRHPFCRCRVVPYNGPTSAGAADALQREARRSVLRGDSGFASEPARLRAADRLLERGAELPATVESRAAAAVRRGRFETEDERRQRRPRGR